MAAMFCPHEAECRVVDGHLQVHPSGLAAREFIRGYLERDERGQWNFIRYPEYKR